MATDTSSSDRDPLERLADEFLDRRRRGENPSPSEYAGKFPQLAEQILEFFPALEIMEGLKPGTGDQTDSSDGQPAQASHHRLEQLGEYRILREIGHGGMGVVYEAIQESLGRRVALKILPLHGRIDPVQIERFRLESRSAARLHHGNIVPVYGVGEHQGVYYYAMQYIQGHGLDVILADLRRLKDGVVDNHVKDSAGSLAVARSLLTGRFEEVDLKGEVANVTRTLSDGQDGQDLDIACHASNGPVSSSVLSHSTESGYYHAVARLGVQVARALAHAHGQGVLHRDIKPSNLLLDVAGHVWITDFGLAKLEGSDGPTQTGDVLGTLRYMPPERFEGWSDRRGDIYGLGMTLYEMLALRPAFEAATRAKLIEQVIHDPPPPPRRFNTQIPRDLETIVLKAIAKEPAERYATAESLALDLENFLSDRPIVARRSSLPEQAWRWCRRNKAAAGLLAASSIAVLALVGVGVSLAFHTKLRTAYAEVDRQRSIAEDALTGEQRVQYYNRVSFAEREMNDNNPYHTEQLLDECPPERRNWEWHYLKRQCHTELLTINAHRGQIWSLAVSPDGRLIATGGEDKTVRVWDAENWHEVHTISGHLDAVWTVALSPDGTRIASVSGAFHQKDKVAVHDVKTGLPVVIPTTRETGQMASIAYSADGNWLVIASGETGSDGWVSVCDSRTGLERFTISVGPRPAMSASLSPDGKSLLAVVGSSNPSDYSNKSNEIRVWDTTTREERLVLRGHTRPVFKASFSPDGRMIVSGGYDPTVRIWDSGSGRELHTLRGHQICVNVTAFSPDGRRIASTSDDGSVKIWDTETGEELLALRGHRGAIYPAAFSHDGRRLFTAGHDGQIKVWDTRTSPESQNIHASDSAVLGVAFSPDGGTLFTAGADRQIKRWEVPSGRLLGTWTGHKEWIWKVCLSRDGKYAASAAGDWQRDDQLGEVKIWDSKTGGVLHSLRAHPGIARSVAFSPDGRWLVSGGGELKTPGQELVVWDVASGVRLRSIPLVKGGVHEVVFSPDGRRLAASSNDIIQTCDARTGENQVIMVGHSGPVSGLAYSPDGRRLVSCGVDGTMRIWDSESEGLLRLLHADRVLCECVAFSPDGTRIASAGGDYTIKLWDPEIDQPLISLRGHSDTVRRVVWSPDGHWIASSDDKGQVKLWDGSPRIETKKPNIARADNPIGTP